MSLGLLLPLALVHPAQHRIGLDRVASMHLCADEWLMQLLGPERIASVTWLSGDPSLSEFTEVAAGLPLNHGRAEELIRLKPDLVLNVAGTSAASVAMLRRFNVRVLEFDVPTSIEQVFALLKVLGAEMQVEREANGLAEHVLSTLESSRLRAEDSVNGQSPVRAVVYEPNGYTVGRSGLVNEVLRAAGLRNVAAEQGLKGYTRLSLEGVVRARPDILIMRTPTWERPSLAEALLHHPIFERREVAHDRLVIRPPPWSCGSPLLARAVAELVAAKEQVLHNRAMTGVGGGRGES